VSRIRAGGSKNCALIPGWRKRIFECPDCEDRFCDPPSFVFTGGLKGGLAGQLAEAPTYLRQNFVFCWPCISLQILGNSQLDALFHVFIYFMSLHVSSVTALIIRRLNCINTSSGMISLCKWLLGMPDRHTKQSLTQTNHSGWCINTIRSPDDERCDPRNM